LKCCNIQLRGTVFVVITSVHIIFCYEMLHLHFCCFNGLVFNLQVFSDVFNESSELSFVYEITVVYFDIVYSIELRFVRIWSVHTTLR